MNGEEIGVNTEEVCNYAAEQRIVEEEELKGAMKEKSKEFVEECAAA